MGIFRKLFSLGKNEKWETSRKVEKLESEVFKNSSRLSRAGYCVMFEKTDYGISIYVCTREDYKKSGWVNSFIKTGTQLWYGNNYEEYIITIKELLKKLKEVV